MEAHAVGARWGSGPPAGGVGCAGTGAVRQSKLAHAKSTRVAARCSVIPCAAQCGLMALFCVPARPQSLAFHRSDCWRRIAPAHWHGMLGLCCVPNNSQPFRLGSFERERPLNRPRPRSDEDHLIGGQGPGEHRRSEQATPEPLGAARDFMISYQSCGARTRRNARRFR